MIQLNRLAGFYWVARTEGYTSAARAFPYPITQAGVYLQVKRLTEELGTELFERVGKERVIMTPAGASLYAHVAPFFEGLPAVIEAVSGRKYGGTLRIHASGLVLRYLLPGWIKRLKRKRPDIEIILEEVGVPDIQLLATGATDLLLDYFAELPDGIETREIATVRGFLVVKEGHPAGRGRKPNMGLLEEETFIAYNRKLDQFGLQKEVERRLGLRPRRTIFASSADTILSLVEAGLGYSFIPSLDKRGPRQRGVRSFPLDRYFEADLPLHAAWRASAADNPLIESFLQLIP